ncbi:MAG: hypothetical protein KKF27_21160, partial [Gammaproteobacteria bacterium]|nr:hypothetical protein [Gammaproteobacteria bacterium]
MGNIGSLDATIGVNTKALDDAGRTIKDFTAGATNQFNSLSRTISQAKYLIATLVAGKIASEMKAYISEVTHIAGRYEELGIAMMTAGRNAGYSERNMKGFEAQLRETGIAANESRESLTKMAAANMDLYKAADLARAAQNLAVVGGINSSQAFQRLTYAIQSSQVEMLRTIGLNITFEAGYKKTADQLGKTTKELTDQEKMLSRTNAVLEGSALYMGLYEGAMESAEKQMGSMQRYIDNYKVAFGEAFQPAYLQSVRRKTELYKQLAEVVSSAEFQTSVKLLAEYYSDIEASVYGWVTANKDLVAQKLPGWVFQFTIWLDEFKLALIPVEVEIMRFAMLLDKVGGTMS